MNHSLVSRLQAEGFEFTNSDPAPSSLNVLRSQMERAINVLDEMASKAKISNRIANDETLFDRAIVKRIREIQRIRRRREELFGPRLFADPSWDILLELYLSSLTQQKVAVSSACRAACVPPTTALRWIAQLEDQGFIKRESDPLDGRRQFLQLTSAAQEKIELLFS